MGRATSSTRKTANAFPPEEEEPILVEGDYPTCSSAAMTPPCYEKKAGSGHMRKAPDGRIGRGKERVSWSDQTVRIRPQRKGVEVMQSDQ